MFKNLNPALRAIAVFVVSFAILAGTAYVIALVKGETFVFPWLQVVGGAAFIELLEFFGPDAEQRRKNRENLAAKFRFNK